MPRVTILLQAATRPSSGPADDPSILAIHLLGSRLSWTTQGGSRRLYSHIRRYRQVHQVDRGEAGLFHSAAKAAEFIQEITHRFGVPNRIITDLGTSFTGSEFRDFCQESCIDVYYASWLTLDAMVRWNALMA